MATVVVLGSVAAAEAVEVLAATAEVMVAATVVVLGSAAAAETMVALEACTYRTWPRRTHPPFGSD